MKRRKMCLLLTLPFVLTGCCKKPLTRIPFNLNSLNYAYKPPRMTFLRNSEEFNNYLNDTNIFTKDPSENFKEINKKYDDNYFVSNDLAAVIIQASSSMIYGYSLNRISKEDNNWIISLHSLSEDENVTCDMGAYYCYYFEFEKDPNIIGAKLVFEKP